MDDESTRFLYEEALVKCNYIGSYWRGSLGVYNRARHEFLSVFCKEGQLFFEFVLFQLTGVTLRQPACTGHIQEIIPMS